MEFVSFFEYGVCIPDEYEQELGDLIIRYAGESDATYKWVLEKAADEFLDDDFWRAKVWDFCRVSDVLDDYEFCGIKTVDDLCDAFYDATRRYLCEMDLRGWFIEEWCPYELNEVEVARIEKMVGDNFGRKEVEREANELV